MYQLMFYGGMAGTFIFLVLSVVLFVKNDVRKRIGDLTGANARKAIKEINEKSKMKHLAKESGEETGKIVIHEEKTENEAEKSIKKASKKTKEPVIRKRTFQHDDTKVPESGDEQTEILPTLNIQEDATDVLYDDEQTSVLAEDEATELLTDEEGTELLNQEDATELLTEEVTETLVSEEETELLYEEVHISAGGFNSILNGATNPDIASGDDEEKTDLLTSTILAGYTDEEVPLEEDSFASEIVPIPDIFEVEEDVTVVHTEDMI